MEVETLPHQAEFLKSTAEEAMLLGGIGSGKSAGGGQFVLKMISEYPNTPGLVVAPTYLQLVKATAVSITNTLSSCGVSYRPIFSGANKRIELPGRPPIHLFTLQDPDNFRGPEAGWLLGDEVCFAKEYAIQVARGRIRHNQGPLYKRFTSSPNGFNWAYDQFENANSPEKQLIRARTKDNHFLPDGYYQSLLREYGGIDNPLARQELNGEFVNLTEGQIYWAFDRDIHTESVEIDKDLPVYIGQDFNIDNMCACVLQKKNGKFFVVDEIVLNAYNSNTDHATEEILRRYGKMRIYIIPDSTGLGRKSSAAGRTDHQIMRDGGLSLLDFRNPFIRDRQNNVNTKLKSGDLIISKKCTKLIKELETVSSRDKEGEVSHVGVSMGYVLWKLAPLLRNRKTATKQL